MKSIRFLITNRYGHILVLLLLLTSCSTQRHMQKIASQTIFADSATENARIGIALYDLSQHKSIFENESHKLFIPASNVKLFTMYESLKHLEDTITAFRYVDLHDTLFVMPTGDPTILSQDFEQDPSLTFLQEATKPIVFLQPYEMPERYGRGWSWDDYTASYMSERNMLNVHKNLEHIRLFKNDDVMMADTYPLKYIVSADSNPLDSSASYIRRSETANQFFYFLLQKDSVIEANVPYKTNGLNTNVKALADLFPMVSSQILERPSIQPDQKCPSQNRDSVLRFMMHHSDNFYAEQMLMMAGMNAFNTCDEKNYLDQMVNVDLSDIPQKPRWIDGSGLSRYNLFSPSDMIYILRKTCDEFGEDQLKSILPTGGEGTMSKMMLSDSGYIYAKTGSMSTVYSLSGLLVTQKGKSFLFSILINGYMGKTSSLKKNICDFLHSIRMSY